MITQKGREILFSSLRKMLACYRACSARIFFQPRRNLSLLVVIISRRRRPSGRRKLERPRTTHAPYQRWTRSVSGEVAGAFAIAERILAGALAFF
jgi:hypothetical protein